jgi:hypothetical protein
VVVCGDAGGFVVEVCAGVAGVPGGAVGLVGPVEVVHAETETETTTVKVAHAAK